MPEAVAPAAPPPTADTKPADAAPDAGAGAAEEPKKPDTKAVWKELMAGKTIKHKGVEKSLADFEPDDAVELMRRGHGASQLVEETKKERAAAQRILELQKAVREGDDDAAMSALWELGGERGLKLFDRLRAEALQEQEAVSKMSDGERALQAELRKTQQERDAFRRAEDERKAAAEKQAEEREHATVKAEALTKANALAKALKGFPPSKVEALGKYIAKAWSESIELGQELGRDVTPDALLKRAEELFKGSTHDFYESMTPEEQFDFLGEEKVRKLSALLVRRVRGGGVAPAAKPAPAAEKPKGNASPSVGDPRYLLR